MAFLPNSNLAKAHAKLLQIQKKHRLTQQDMLRILVTPTEESVTLSIFNTEAGALEALCDHLQRSGKSAAEIASLLKRSYTTITNTLRQTRSKKYAPGKQTLFGETLVPLRVFADRTRGPLQALVLYLHDERHMRFVDIARAVGRDPRNINTTYQQVRR